MTDTATQDQDTDGGILSAFLDIGVKLGESADALTGLHKRIERQAGTTVTDSPRVGQVVVPAGGVAVIPLGSPDGGHRWMLQQWAVGGLTVTTAAAGIADLFVAGVDPTLGVGQIPSLLNWRGRIAALPGNTWAASRQVIVRAEEYLFIVVTGATVAQTYVATAQVTDYQESASYDGVTPS